MFWWIILGLSIRLPVILSGIIPFSFDHGRDALAALHLIKTFNPVFIGPWTSIPGLFFGPGWYYLIAPALAIFRGNPAGPVYLMLCLNLITLSLAYKYWGWLAAAMVALAPGWMTLSTGAANPFPMGLLGILLIIAWQKRHYFYLGLIVGLGFHFSSALAVMWLALMAIFIGPKNWTRFFLGLILPFIPQLLFEIKNDWIETKAVIAYFAAGESQQLTPGKISLVSQAYWHELSLAILPDKVWLKMSGLAILSWGFLKSFKRNSQLWLLLTAPLIGFWLLHYNPWYVYGLLPLAVILSAKILAKIPKLLQIAYLLILLIGSGMKLTEFIVSQRDQLLTHKSFLPAKLSAINYIYSQAAGKPFNSYHYLPEIYDYAYQYLYFWQGFSGKPMPVEFSYQPQAPEYIGGKNDLLDKLTTTDGPPMTTFLIIEKPDNVWHYPLESWLEQLEFTEIVSRKIIGQELEVWQVN